MARHELSKKDWQQIQSRLLEKCNNGYEPTYVEISLVKNSNNYRLEIIPASSSTGALHCLEEVVDMSRAFGLSCYVSLHEREDGSQCCQINIF